MDAFLAFVSVLAGLVPVVGTFASLISYIVDAAKRLGLPDGYAPLASGLLNVAAYTLVYFATDTQRAEFPNAVAAIQTIAPYVLALLTSVLAAPAIHDALVARGFGFSHPKTGG